MVTLEASHVVLASPEPGAGRARVLESWRGDLKPGAKLLLPDLAAIGSESARLALVGYRWVPISADRAVLFLKKEGEDWKFAKRWNLALVLVDGSSTLSYTLPATYGSLGWIGLNPTELHARINLTVHFAEEVAKTGAIEDPKARARALAPLLTSSFVYGRFAAERALRTCGSDAVPVLRELLGKSSLLPLHGEFLNILVELASAEESSEQLKAFLENDLRFWRELAPRLDDLWWQGAGLAGEAEQQYLLVRLERSRIAVIYADNHDEAGVKRAAKDLRDVWRREASLAQLKQYMGITDEVKR